jgi:hypothetical protein
LRAPIAITVETRGRTRDGVRRAFRLARNIGADGIALERRAPFELGRPIEVRFTLPDGGPVLRLPAEVRPADDDEEEQQQIAPGGSELVFLAPGEDERQALHRYVLDRLGLPEGVS